LVREIEVLTDARLTLLADRRRLRPYGLEGGEEGAAGAAWIVKADGSKIALPGKCSRQIKQGESVRIETPGGGGWGRD
jgi:N-methylhydantoinase B